MKDRIDYVNNERLLFFFHLLLKINNGKTSNVYEGNYYSPDTFLLDDYKLVKESNAIYSMNHMLKNNIASDIYIKQYKFTEGLEREFVSESHFTQEDVNKKNKEKGNIDLSPIIDPKKFCIKGYMSEYYLNINKLTLGKWISEYLNKWQENQLFLPSSNYPKTSSQIEEMVEEIYRDLKSYPSLNLIVDSSCSEHSLDYIPNMIFLHEKEFISIKEIIMYHKQDFVDIAITGLAGGWGFRVDIKQKFYDMFNYKSDKFSKQLFFDWNEVISTNTKDKASDIKKEDISKDDKISFDVDSSKLLYMRKECIIPKLSRGKNLTYQHLLCNLVFNKEKLKLGDRIPFDLIYDEFGLVDERGSEKNIRTIKDTIRTINKSYRNIFGKNIFICAKAEVGILKI